MFRSLIATIAASVGSLDFYHSQRLFWPVSLCPSVLDRIYFTHHNKTQNKKHNQTNNNLKIMSTTSNGNSSLFTVQKIAEIEMAAEWLITLLLYVSDTDRQSILTNLQILGDGQGRVTCTKKRLAIIQAIKSVQPASPSNSTGGTSWGFPVSFELVQGPSKNKLKPRSLIKRTLLQSQGKIKQWEYLRTKTVKAFRNLSTVDFIGQPKPPRGGGGGGQPRLRGGGGNEPVLLRGYAELVHIGIAEIRISS